MRETIRTARKVYKCDYCGGHIQKGNKYLHLQTRVPVYEEFDKDEYGSQIGVEYISLRVHLPQRCVSFALQNSSEPVQVLKKCNFGNHSIKTFTEGNIHGVTGEYTCCEWCGKNKK